MSAPALMAPHVPAPTPSLRHRHDGWTPDRQRRFCEAIAEGETVEAACMRVQMAPSTAYALRRRAVGASFALAWDAARLLGRERLGDALHARAIEGVVETITRPDGTTVTRHRFDTRLATMMLRRADRHAEGLDGAHGQAARLVAAEFDAFLDLLERGEGPARAGLFLGTRLGDDDEALAPIVALARADTWLRTGAARGGEVDVADLDPAQRSGWTAEQWVRAEAAGLFAIAAPPAPLAETVSTSPLSPLPHEDDAENPVWWCEESGQWWTRFPPPADFYGEEDGRYGEPGYSRALSAEESLAIALADVTRTAPGRIAEARERDAWFAALADGGEGEGDAAADPCHPAERVPASPVPLHPVDDEGEAEDLLPPLFFAEADADRLNRYAGRLSPPPDLPNGSATPI